MNTVTRVSMDEIDRQSFSAGPSPMDSPFEMITLQQGAAAHPAGASCLSLNGVWDMAEGGDENARLTVAWSDVIRAEVPGSVHAALVKAGKIPDPTIGQQDAFAREQSFKTWWLKRTFPRPADVDAPTLSFGGICSSATIWLNGHLLGSHIGMFGGPEYAVAEYLQDENTLIVKIDPAPYVEGTEADGFFKGMNVGWMRTVVFNNVYGWHYSNIPALGIWRPVMLVGTPAVRINNPFIATLDAEQGLVDFTATLDGSADGWRGQLLITIEPDNFTGKACHFSYPVRSTEAAKALHLRFAIPDPHLWWPLDIGEQHLYQVKLSFLPDGDGIADYRQVQIGLRTIEMAPLPDGPDPEKYNWTFIINKRPTFVKGNGWCTLDPLMDFSRERYDRFLTLAARQHVQMMRAWGAGMPETDDFYDLADRKGILIMQEWPTAWNSHEIQPYDALEETIRLNTLRLRNHASLAMWGGGNESEKPFGVAIDMMGRYSIELDGTRAFHRGEPWGGSRHDYGCWWGKCHLNHNVQMTADFFGEFGIASLPNYESIQRYLPDAEKELWPAPDGGSFAHHTPCFNGAEDMARLAQYSGYFMPDDTMQSFILGSQIAQATAVRHTLERARTRWPYCTGSLYYKMNDNFPAASWSCADWYGAAKIGYYFFQDSFTPLHACITIDELNPVGKALALPVFLLDDAEALRDAAWAVTIRAYNAQLAVIKESSFAGAGLIDRVRQLGEFTLTADQTETTPLLIVSEVQKDGELVDRTFYWLNYESVKGCLFMLPPTTLSVTPLENALQVTNTGSVPAVGVHFVCPDCADTFLADDNYFWLEPGESKTVSVNCVASVGVSAWNAN